MRPVEDAPDLHPGVGVGVPIRRWPKNFSLSTQAVRTSGAL
jgi:hypothetical protein